jgi:hypothetical protein
MMIVVAPANAGEGGIDGPVITRSGRPGLGRPDRAGGRRAGHPGRQGLPGKHVRETPVPREEQAGIPQAGQPRLCETPLTWRARERPAQNLAHPPQAPLLPLARRAARQGRAVSALMTMFRRSGTRRTTWPAWGGASRGPVVSEPLDGVALGVGMAKGVSRRRGDCRAVYWIDDERHLVIIVAIELAPTSTARDNSGRDGPSARLSRRARLVTGAWQRRVFAAIPRGRPPHGIADGIHRGVVRPGSDLRRSSTRRSPRLGRPSCRTLRRPARAGCSRS